MAEKTLSGTLNDINSRNEVRASRYLTIRKTTKQQHETYILSNKLYNVANSYSKSV